MFTKIAGSLLLLPAHRFKVQSSFALKTDIIIEKSPLCKDFFKKAIKFLKFRRTPKNLDIRTVLT